MIPASRPAPVPNFGLTVAFATAVLWMLRGYLWPTYSNVEVGPLQALLDPALFRHDFTVQESLRFTPRFYYNQLILLPTQFGLSLAASVALWQAAALGTLVAAVYSLGLGTLATAGLLVWLLLLNLGSIGGVSFHSVAPIPSVWAASAAAAGAALAVRRRIPAAYACFAAAVLLQFLVGFYAGLLALPALLLATPAERIRALAVWALGLALVYVPLTLAGTGDATALPDAAFVEIYAHLRHPHHLVPSTWPAAQWQRTLLFYGGAWYFLFRTREGRHRVEVVLLHTTVLLTAAALALNYAFVEVWPSAFVAKLQPARITPLAQAVLLALIATRVRTAWNRGLWFLALLLCAIPFTLFPGHMLALAGVLGAPERTRANTAWPVLLLAAAAVLAFKPLPFAWAYKVNRYGPLFVPLVALAAPVLLRRSTVALALAAAVAWGGLFALARASVRPGWSGTFLFAPWSWDAAPVDPPAILGERFRLRSAPDDLVLVPPTSEPWIFKLYARRAVVVDDKNIPFTTAGLREWHDRMQRVLGVPFARQVDTAAAWAARSPAEVCSLAASFGARFVLTRRAWHPQLAGRMLDVEGDWTLWEMPAPPP
jgi:hypothetical protein